MTPRGLAIAGWIAVACVAAWAGVRMHGSQTPAPPIAADPAPTASAGDFEALIDPAVPTPQIPEKLPQFSLLDRAGNRTPISTWHDKSLIINFWATWCAPCRQEIPLLETLYGEWSSRDIEVVGIAVDHREQVLQYANQMKIPYPLLIGEEDALDAATALGFVSPVFPFTVFTDRHGDVVTLFVGELHRPQADLILSVVQSLNEDRIRLAAARHTIAAGLAALAPKG